MTDAALQQLRDVAQRGDAVQVHALLALRLSGYFFESTYGRALTAAVCNDHVSSVAAFQAWCSPTHVSRTRLVAVAARHNSLQVLALLITAKASVNSAVTPLIFAAGKGHLSCVSLLLAVKATVNLLHAGADALHYAARRGHADVVECLVHANADFHSHDINGRTPLSVAAAGSHEHVLRVLLDARANVNLSSRPRHKLNSKPLTAACYSSLPPNVFRLLLDARADVHVATTYWGDTVLSLAAQTGRPDTVIKMILRAKANVHSASADCYTALHQAAKYGRRSIVDLLLRAKADVRAVTTDGDTALTLACRYNHLALAAYFETRTCT
jgi:ankyrin repeat protein